MYLLSFVTNKSIVPLAVSEDIETLKAKAKAAWPFDPSDILDMWEVMTEQHGNGFTQVYIRGVIELPKMHGTRNMEIREVELI